MKDWLNKALDFFIDNNWVIQVFSVILLSLIASYFLKRILNRLLNRLESTKSKWDDLVLKSALRPATWLIWFLGVLFAADIVYRQSGAMVFEAIAPIRNVGVIAIITMFLLNLTNGTREILKQHDTEEDGKDYDEHTVDAISKLIRISIFITSALVILQTLGYSISGVLAFGGIGGIAVGFAAKDLLSNFFGGLMIYLDRPFKVGDWVRSSDREIEGTVEYIGWRLTHIRTFDKRPLYVPNAVFTTISVENPSRMTNRRIYETIGIRYDDVNKMEVIVNDVKKMLRAHPEIDQEATMIVNFIRFSSSSIDFFVYTFTKTTEWVRFHEIKQDVLLKIVDIIAGHGAEIAFPTSTLHIESLPDPESA